jgi:hypothetical protein
MYKKVLVHINYLVIAILFLLFILYSYDLDSSEYLLALLIFTYPIFNILTFRKGGKMLILSSFIVNGVLILFLAYAFLTLFPNLDGIIEYIYFLFMIALPASALYYSSKMLFFS